MAVELRPYQEKIIKRLRRSFHRGNRKIILCAPTGSGKTIMFSFMVKAHLELGGSVLVFTHRKELLSQAGGAFEKFGLDPEFIDAGSNPDLSKHLHVSMIETFNRRLEDETYIEFLASRTMIVIDEAHFNTFTKIFEYISSGTLVIGATATPYRKGSGVPSLEDFYTDIVQEVDTPELINLGFLSKAKTYGQEIDLSKARKVGDDYDVTKFYEENKVYRGVVENWERICKGTKTLLFASNVENSKKVCEEFNLSGYPAKHLDADTPDAQRTQILEWLDETLDAIVCNCGILTSGFDQPDIETIVLYRATTSLPLFLQMCGRGSRITNSKSSFNILDFGNNVRRLNFWEDYREWSLKKDGKVSSKEGVIPVKECRNCTALIPTSVNVCPHCGFEYIKTQNEKDDEEVAKLALIPPHKRRNIMKGKSNRLLVKMVRAKVIGSREVLKSKTDVEDAREFCRLMGYNMPYWEDRNWRYFKVFKRGKSRR